MIDVTEPIRRARVAELNAGVITKENLEAKHSQLWTTDQLREEFEVLGFMAPLVVVRRLSDGKKGSLEFAHSPRYYFNWQEH